MVIALPPSPLTRWQNHGGHRGGATGGHQQRARWSPPGGGTPRYERRNVPSNAPQHARPNAIDRRFDPSQARPRPRPDVARSAPQRPQPPRPPAPRSAPGAATASGKIDAFDLFCAYHLGITPEGGYRIQNIHEVARRFGINAAELRQILVDLGMAADDIVHSGFDLPGAQVDIMVAPEGISRCELARPLYDEFRSTPKQARDWKREMEDAQRQIEKTIGRDGRWSPTARDAGGKQS